MFSSLSIERVDSCVPITALKEIQSNSKKLLLQAQGPYTLLLDVKSGVTLSTIRTFERQEIHGFVVKDFDCISQESGGSISIIAWGGSSVRALRIELNARSTLICTSAEFHAPDRILDACPSQSKAGYDAYFVTGHNSVLGLRVILSRNDRYPYEAKIWQLAASVKSTLYSADIVSVSATHVLVAAGTVFGDIVVWSCFKQNGESLFHKYSASIHHFFTGHEGSIFGVNISPEIPDLIHGQNGRLLASCSDDRTIRVWDISDCNSASPTQTPAYSTDGFELRKTGFSINSPQLQAQDSESYLAKSWGHESRIWAVKFLSPRSSSNQQLSLLSRGEDATCQSWKLTWDSQNERSIFNLENITTLHSHAKKNIWAWDISETEDNTIVYTGGADGALREVSFTTIPEKVVDKNPTFSAARQWKSATLQKVERASAESTPSMRAFDFVSDRTVIAVTMGGKALVGEVDNGRCLVQWRQLLESEELRSCHCVTGSTSHNVGLIGNDNGVVLLYNNNLRSLYELITLARRPLGLFIVDQKSLTGKRADNVTSVSILATYPSSDLADLFLVRNIQDATHFHIEKTIQVHLPSAFQVSCATLLGGGRTLIVGGRLGGIAIYDLELNQERLEYVYCERREHSKESVLVINQISSDRGEDGEFFEYVLTCGRDGYYCVHELRGYEMSKSAITFQRIHRSACSVDMAIVGAYMDSDRQHLILYGFRANRFISWNESTQTELMSLDCGGAKRNWAFQPLQENAGAGTFLWVKAGVFNVRTSPAIHRRALVAGSHGRELKSISISGSYAGVSGGPFMATGAEDSTIRIYQLDPRGFVWHRDRTRVLHNHTTGTQQIIWSRNGKYLFTGAGMEEFFVWKVRSIPVFGLTAIFEASSPKDNEMSDPRVMSFDIIEIDASSGKDCFLIALAFSNSTVKMFLYTASHGEEGDFHLLARGTYTTNCIFQLRFIRTEESLSLLTGATDGHAAIWKLDDILEPVLTLNSAGIFSLKHRPTQLIPAASIISWGHKYTLHRSSIKALELIELSGGDTLLVTGGDDNALAVSILHCTQQSPQHHLTTVSVPDAHASAINTIKILDIQNCRLQSSSTFRSFLIASCGNDHRFKIWSVLVDLNKQGPEALDITQKIDRYTPVADVSCLDTFLIPDVGGTENGEHSIEGVRDMESIGLILGGVGVEILKVNIGVGNEVGVSDQQSKNNQAN